jgi:hypothetical protein
LISNFSSSKEDARIFRTNGTCKVYVQRSKLRYELLTVLRDQTCFPQSISTSTDIITENVLKAATVFGSKNITGNHWSSLLFYFPVHCEITVKVVWSFHKGNSKKTLDVIHNRKFIKHHPSN